MNTESTLLYDPHRANWNIGIAINLGGGNLWLSPVKAAGTIRTRNYTVPTPDTLAIIYNYNAIWLLPGSINGTNLDAGRILTLVALDW
jgi:hypothetical protein